MMLLTETPTSPTAAPELLHLPAPAPAAPATLAPLPALTTAAGCADRMAGARCAMSLSGRAIFPRLP